MVRRAAALNNPDVRAETIAFSGEQQYFFLGLVSRSWRGGFKEGEKKTAYSQIVTSAPRAMTALAHGWTADNSAWRCAVKLGNMEVLNVLLDEIDAEVGVWGDGVFSAAVEAGHTDVLEFLIVEGCAKDGMGLKALEVAIEFGSAAILECCFSTDLVWDRLGSVL